MNRIVLYTVALLLLFSCSQRDNYHHNSKHFKLIKLSEGVYACVHKFGGKAICNVGIIDNGNETVIFDSFITPLVTQELLVIVEELNLSPIKYVINSHWHNDHIRGNQVFADDVRIISTKKTAELIAENEPQDIAYEKEHAPAKFHHYDSLYKAFDGDTGSREYKVIQMWRPYFETLMDSHKEVVTRLPDTFVSDEMNLDGPDRKIVLIDRGQGHTESDLILYLPDEGILFTGDLVFNDSHPYVPHGNLNSWLSWLTYMQSLNIETIVPGHGEIGGPEELGEMKHYLIILEDEAKKMVAAGMTAGQVEEMEIPNQFQDWWFDRFYYYNLKFIYNIKAEEQSTLLN